MRLQLRYAALVAVLLITGCMSVQKDTVMQLSTIDALLAGAYDGDLSCRELLKHGSMGIGTFDGLAGEMIVVDSQVYQVKADGKVYRPEMSTTTPFAAVCHFEPDSRLSVPEDLDYQGVKDLLDKAAPNENVFVAIRIKGKFRTMHTRSVPAQTKPYPKLAEVAKNQPEFKMKDLSGTIVGFRCPPYVTGIGVPGYHLHFLSEDLKSGGHILGFTTLAAEAEIDICNRFYLVLPGDGSSLDSLDLSSDRSAELHAVEQ